MKNLNIDQLSPFGQLALDLDCDFSELERLSGQIERLAIDTDNGLERGLKLLAQFAGRGQKIAEGIQGFAQAMDAARQRAEKAAKNVAERAIVLQERKAQHDSLNAKFGLLGTKVQGANATLAELKKPSGQTISSAERALMSERLREIDSSLSDFVEEAQAIKVEAHQANLKLIERNAESLYGTVQSARRKLAGAVTG